MIDTSIITELREGDVVTIRSNVWRPEGTTVTSPLWRDERGRLRFGVKESTDTPATSYPKWMLTDSDGMPSMRNRERTLELVSISDTDNERVPTGPDKAGLIDLITWLGGEKAKQDVGLPSEWNQGSWLAARYSYAADGRSNMCGTTACAAGHVVLKAGARFALYERDEEGDNKYDDDGNLVLTPVTAITDDMVDKWDTSDVIRPDTGERISVSDYARELLRLDAQQAADLFSGANSYDAMMRHLSDLLALCQPASTREERLRAAIAKEDERAAAAALTAELAASGNAGPFDYDRTYAKGDRVLIDGKVYEARIDGPCSSSPVTVQNDSSPTDRGGACWLQLGPVVTGASIGAFATSSPF